MPAASHRPPLAAPADDAGPPRSLLLAGGGMRVAYQAGVLVALQTAGLTFSHADGTSGGTMNLAMLLSGLGPEEMCHRWRTLNPRRFASVSVRRLLRGPPYPALGSSDGIRDAVYPHLGIDVGRIRAAEGLVGTFNVCDFQRKVTVAVPNDEVDEDLLVAGISLPVFSPAVRHRGSIWMDSVWIQDVNVAEAVRRGARELWLVWAIGNHGRYRDGVFQQYVHMIELAANGSLFKELAQVRERATADDPVRLHVIRPRSPLPLDPDYFLGRVDAATLIAMGHRDACAYLDTRDEAGVALDHTATRMDEPRPGVGFRETLEGSFGGRPVRVALSWEIEDLEQFAARGCGQLVGDASHEALGERALARSGGFERSGRHWAGELRFAEATLHLTRREAAWHEVDAHLVDGGGAEIGSGRLRARPRAPWTTLHARGVVSAFEGARAIARFAELVVRA